MPANRLPLQSPPAMKSAAILWAVSVAVFWGLYGHALQNGRSAAKPPEWSSFKPYLWVGIAYLAIAVVGGAIAMKLQGDNFDFSGKYRPAMTWGFLAGAVGAIGALALTFALVKSKGNAALVMPIVFGGAVVVNALVSLIRLRGNPDLHTSPLLWVGMALVATGIVLTARFAPHGAPAKPAVAVSDEPGETVVLPKESLPSS